MDVLYERTRVRFLSPSPLPRSHSSCWHLTQTPVSAVSYVFLPLSQWHLIPRASFDLCRWLWSFCRIGWQMLNFWLRDYETWCAHDTVLIDFPRKEKKKKTEIKKEKLGFWWDEIPHAFLSFPKQDRRVCEPPRRPCLSVSSLVFPLYSLRLLTACSPHPLTCVV